MRSAIEAAALLGVVWIHWRRRRYRRAGVPLSVEERSAFAPYFDSALLDSIRVCRVQRIHPGLPPRVVRALHLPASVDISSAAGMAFVDAVAMTDCAKRDPLRLLFHELVHCVQYHELGTHRFLRHYLLGWARAGFDYFAIPLEVQAYRLQDRFEIQEVFDARKTVRDELISRKYLRR